MKTTIIVSKGTCLRSITVSVLFLVCCTGSVFTQATKPEARVSKVFAETEDSVVFRAGVSKTEFLRGDDIPIDYRVKNKGTKTVYLVVESSTRVFVNEGLILQMLEPVSRPRPHDPYDYELIKISPNETFNGTLVLKAKSYLSSKRYNFEIASIQVGFSYLFDKSLLEDCEKSAYAFRCLGELYEKSKSLMVGNLVVEIRKE